MYVCAGLVLRNCLGAEENVIDHLLDYSNQQPAVYTHTRHSSSSSFTVKGKHISKIDKIAHSLRPVFRFANLIESGPVRALAPTEYLPAIFQRNFSFPSIKEVGEEKKYRRERHSAVAVGLGLRNIS